MYNLQYFTVNPKISDKEEYEMLMLGDGVSNASCDITHLIRPYTTRTERRKMRKTYEILNRRSVYVRTEHASGIRILTFDGDMGLLFLRYQ
jgi:hypothetical protein